MTNKQRAALREAALDAAGEYVKRKGESLELIHASGEAFRHALALAVYIDGWEAGHAAAGPPNRAKLRELVVRMLKSAKFNPVIATAAVDYWVDEIERVTEGKQ